MIKAVIFDFDGTITKPYLNFRRIKKDIGLPEDEIYLLERISEMPEPKRQKALKILEDYESEAVANSVLNDGVREVLDFLKKADIKTALLTRNSRTSTDEACRKHRIYFDLVITRDDVALKPKPDGIIFASRKLNIPLKEIILVGDYLFDIMAGKNAGVKTVLLSPDREPNWDVKSDYTIKKMIDLLGLIDSK